MKTNDRILLAAYSQIGTSEITGDVDEPRIIKYFSEIGHSWVKDDETAWCAAFANWVCLYALVEGTGKLNARSFLDVGETVDLDEAQPGDAVILWRKSPTAAEGHVAFFLGFSPDKKLVYLFGGNQDNKVGPGKFDPARVLGVRRLKSLIS